MFTMEEAVQTASIKLLRELITAGGLSHAGIVEKSELREQALRACSTASPAASSLIRKIIGTEALPALFKQLEALELSTETRKAHTSSLNATVHELKLNTEQLKAVETQRVLRGAAGPTISVCVLTESLQGDASSGAERNMAYEKADALLETLPALFDQLKALELSSETRKAHTSTLNTIVHAS
jgi:hypothetical protein